MTSSEPLFPKQDRPHTSQPSAQSLGATFLRLSPLRFPPIAPYTAGPGHHRLQTWNSRPRAHQHFRGSPHRPMSRPPEPGSGPARPIPPIEIGSFVARAPDDSEFIGSGSGVFFANTVFRAFARAAPAAAPDAERPSGAEGSTAEADPGSAHTYLVAPEGEDEQAAAGDARQDGISESCGGRSYGVVAPGLGVAPPPAIARELLMLYFRHWHPFFPFLHGPTFVDSVDSFYEEDAASKQTASPLNPRRLARAITFQCIFNIAASASGHTLDAAHRIQSSSALTSIIGVIFANHDIASLQALLAAELYLTTTMSLRAASTIHGALTRTMYSSGFHRCPCRYVQLPPDMAGIRKRTFWCAYILDRHLSQALGHPPSIEDAHVDVCIPGMAELHTAAKNRESAAAQSTLNEEVLDHLPKSRVGTGRGDEAAPAHLGRAAGGGFSACSPAQHHTVVGSDADRFVLSYMATYSRLMGEIVNSFHNSIHARALSHEKTQELTHRIHCWWNSMPSTLQDDSHDASSPPSRSPRVAFFTMLYNYLILIINRPFLSLPTERMEFQSSLQTAVGASRSIITKLERCADDPFLAAWPGTLSAAWTAGLVIAFASLLELYPLIKGIS